MTLDCGWGTQSRVISILQTRKHDAECGKQDGAKAPFFVPFGV